MEYIYVSNNSLSNETCDEIIDFFNKSPDIYNGVVQEGVVPTIKHTIDLYITKHRSDFENKLDIILFNELNKQLKKYIKEVVVNKNHYDNDSLFSSIFDTGFQIQYYKKNKGKFEKHNDFTVVINDNHLCPRIFSYIWYLNDVEEGGETEFFLDGAMKIKPEKGKFIIFPATWTYLHKGNKPISNDKYIITGWVYDKKIKIK